MLSSTFTLFPSPTVARNSLLSHAHKVAIKHSSSLARDLRIALGGVFVAQPNSMPTQSVFCLSNGGGVIVSNGNGSFSPPSGTSTASSSQPTSTSSVSSSPWKPIATYSGNTFFNGWNFFTGSDPTHGNVQYVDQGTAQNAGLAEINKAGNAVMRVETTPTVQNNRMSVRIATNVTFTEGLVILDAVHMPTGCGTWPGEYHFFAFTSGTRTKSDCVSQLSGRMDLIGLIPAKSTSWKVSITIRTTKLRSTPALGVVYLPPTQVY